MQALKQAARENDETRLVALCESWSLPVSAAHPETEKAEVEPVNESNEVGRP
jgi:hypothetical protein